MISWFSSRNTHKKSWTKKLLRVSDMKSDKGLLTTKIIWTQKSTKTSLIKKKIKPTKESRSSMKT